MLICERNKIYRLQKSSKNIKSQKILLKLFPPVYSRAGGFMLNTISLNSCYARYSAGLLGRGELEVLVFEKIRKEIRTIRLPGWEDEDYNDYISWLYPRLSRAINTYRETGSSFEAYIGTLMRMTVKEYRHRLARDYVNETVAWNASTSDMFAFEKPPDYDETVTAEKTGTVRNPRQLLILVLKCCHYASPDFLERIAPRLGVEAEALDRWINQLKDGCIKRMKRIEQLRENINSLFCRCIVYEKTLLAIEGESAVRHLEEKLERGRNRLARMRIKLARTRREPSNSQIARLLDVTKGTVDAALHSLRIRRNGSMGDILN
jgi:DNA-binding MarR family transcriptional regulator